MPTLETFAAELEALVDKYGHCLNSDEIITALEQALSRAWGFACEPQPASLFEHAPEMRDALKAADEALAQFTAFEADARYIMGNTNFAIVQQRREQVRAAIAAAEGR